MSSYTDPTNLEQNLLKYKTDTRLWDTFKSHEPYKRGDSYSGGDNIIRSLAAMANDKHTVGLFVRPDVQRIGFPRIEINDIQTMSMSNPRWDDTKAEMELGRVDKPYPDFDSSELNEPKKAIGQLVISCCHAA